MVYHKNIGFPKTLVIPDVILSLTYTKHAKERKDESYNLMVVPSVVRLQPSNVIEVHTEDNINIKKTLIRIKYTQTQDMILVLEPLFDQQAAKVITLWVNNKKDHHKSLKKQYDTP